MGTRLMQSLGLRLGDSVTLISPRGADTPFGKSPRSKAYQISAVFEMGMSEYDKTMMFMPMAEAKKYFSRGDTVDVLEVVVDGAEKVDGYVKLMEAQAGEAYSFTTWKQRNASFFTVLEVERTVMFIILSLIILVAALNIISGMMMLVKDKSRDIAVLRTMGATKGAMMRVFLITGASIGVVGTFAGLIVAILFCWKIDQIRLFVQWVTGTTVMDPSVYYLTKLPADMNVRETIGIVVMALVITLLATLYPSWRASKLDPVEALRYE
jgi:lipoprotein-releasing system permease protein